MQILQPKKPTGDEVARLGILMSEAIGIQQWEAFRQRDQTMFHQDTTRKKKQMVKKYDP
jgi:hypothetical protein